MGGRIVCGCDVYNFTILAWYQSLRGVPEDDLKNPVFGRPRLISPFLYNKFCISCISFSVLLSDICHSNNLYKYGAIQTRLCSVLIILYYKDGPIYTVK